MLDGILQKIKKYLIPEKVFGKLQRPYHYTMSLIAAVVYRFPSKKIKVIAVTGTKGKSSTVEIINAILEEAGYKTALSNTIRFKIGDLSWDNMYKMSMPGRFFVQRLLRRSIKAGCQYVVLEMTSQGALLFRHRFIELDALVFTNISPEHIEAHGSFDNYLFCKLSIAENMKHSKKQNRTVIANADDAQSTKFLDAPVERKMTFSIKDAEPYEVMKEGINFTLDGRNVHSGLSGLFNLYNILAAVSVGRSQNVSDNEMIRAVEKFSGIPGRVQKVTIENSEVPQDFSVIVDYAHTPDSLEKLYQVFQSSKNICVLGGTGGGRDSWKRAEMGRIADKYCEEIILTDEDPYDEDPRKIVEDVAKGVSTQAPSIIMDRREAIREAIKKAKTGDTVIITGKGTDPYIMGPNGQKTPWSDATVAKEELEKVLRG